MDRHLGPGEISKNRNEHSAFKMFRYQPGRELGQAVSCQHRIYHGFAIRELVATSARINALSAIAAAMSNASEKPRPVEAHA
jgi:hypothetical protein